MKVVVIGAGASGMVSAITASKKSYEVILIDKNSSCGKKLLVTGNGRCNYYNADQNINHYHSNLNTKISGIINEDTNKKVLKFFNELGVVPRIKDGYYYPYSNQAVSIQNALYLELKNSNVKLLLDTDVLDIEKVSNNFIVKCNNTTLKADKVIVATGSIAYLKDASSYNFYEILDRLGHNIVKVLPALVSLNCEGSFLKEWSGIRSDVNIKLYEDDKYVKEENGEILLTNYGVSGICVMQLSRYVGRYLDENKKCELVINFLNKFLNSRDEFIEYMDNRDKLLKNRNITELLDSILNYKLINVLVRQAGINTTKKWQQLTSREKSILASYFVEFHLQVKCCNNFSKAQAVSGGVSLSDVNLSTMESLRVKNLYFCGEVLDVDGDCGGYNLTFAWTTGLIAGDLSD